MYTTLAAHVTFYSLGVKNAVGKSQVATCDTVESSDTVDDSLG